jgi:N6-L-threonylcarbamoyladenine synthase
MQLLAAKSYNRKPKIPMTILAIETSCDETAVAILRDRELLVSEVASQIAAHEQYGGIVPEVASRNHLQNAPRLLERARTRAGVSLGEIDAFAATSGPGLASSLMIGASIGKGLALGYGKPYLAINHLEGHLLSPFFGGETEPNLSLVVSGGHTLLVQVRGVNDYVVLGQTVDDAAGEAFDKVAKMLGLGYPGGPEIERHARNGNPTRFDLPRSMLDSGDLNFSFSGLKTAVRYLLPKLQGDFLDDLCASFQSAVVDVLVEKTLRAARQARVPAVTLSGGVSCNHALRMQLSAACEKAGLKFLPAASELCTDNAAMIAFAASLRLARGFCSSVTDEIDPNLALGQT